MLPPGFIGESSPRSGPIPGVRKGMPPGDGGGSIMSGCGAGGGGDCRQLHLETNKHRYQVHLGLLLMRKERLFPKRQVHLEPSLSSAPAPRSNRHWFQSQCRHFTPVSKRRQASVCSPIKWASHLSQVLFERIKLN